MAEKMRDTTGGEIKLFYCNSCRYIFEEAEGCQQCPDCGKMTVRIANEEERSEYKRNQEENRRLDQMERGAF